ncbi:MAG: hypothetical protein ABW049_04930 [Spongiibacteraceae bacterium]
MTPTLWIVIGVSVLAIIGFVLVIRSQLRENREIDSKIDYSKVKPWVEDDEEKEREEKWGK